MKKQNNEKVAAAEGCLSHKADLQEVLSLRKQLTDVGQFAYAGLCAVCLYRLYSNEWDKYEKLFPGILACLFCKTLFE